MSSLVCPVRGKNSLPGLLIATSRPAASTRIFLGSAMARSEDLGQIVADRLLQLGVGTRVRFPVRAPADELGGVPEPRAFHVVVADLEYAFGPQRDERQVLGRVPPAALGLARGALTPMVPGPVPRMPVERSDQRLQFAEQLTAPLHRKGADHAHAGQFPF